MTNLKYYFLFHILLYLNNYGMSQASNMMPPFSYPYFLNKSNAAISRDVKTQINLFDSSPKTDPISDSAEFNSIRMDFRNTPPNFYKILILPDKIHEKCNLVLIKNTLEEYAYTVGIPLSFYVWNENIKLKYYYSNSNYAWVGDFVAADAIITSSFENYKVDSIMSHLYYYYKFDDGNDTIICHTDTTFSIIGGMHITKYYNKIVPHKINNSLNAFTNDKINFFKGSFLNDFKSNLLNYFIDKNRDIDSLLERNLFLCDEILLLNPHDNSTLYKKLMLVLKNKTTPNNKKFLIANSIANEVLSHDSLDYIGNFVQALVALNNLASAKTDCFNNYHAYTDTISIFLKRMKSSKSIDTPSLNFIELEYNEIIGNSMACINILQKSNSINFPSYYPTYNRDFFNHYYQLYLSDTLIQNKKKYLDSAKCYIQKENDIILTDYKSPMGAITNYDLYTTFIMESGFYFKCNDSSNFDKTMELLETINSISQSSQIDLWLSEKKIKLPCYISALNLDFQPAKLHDAYMGDFYKIKYDYYLAKNNYDSLEKYVNLLCTLPDRLFKIHTAKDSLILGCNYSYIYSYGGYMELIRDFGIYSFDHSRVSKARIYLSWYYDNTIIDSVNYKNANLTFWELYFKGLYDLYQIEYMNGRLDHCIQYLDKTFLPNMENHYSQSIKTSYNLWYDEILKNSTQLKLYSPDKYRLIQKRFKEIKKKFLI